MFCPKCATQNMDGARFCRACGADISLVPHAMSGHLPEAQATALEATGQTDNSSRRRRRRRGNEAPNLEKGIKSTFSGIGFLIVTIVLAFTPMGRGWWFWMFIPAFATLGGGIAEIVRARYGQSLGPSSAQGAVSAPPLHHASELPPRRNTSELMPPPPSVTEGTTRHLGSEGPTEFLATPRGKTEKNG
ncbi:MAG: zinc ribbon domain-containing protein [Pyrinomonadaceae bacterium]